MADLPFIAAKRMMNHARTVALTSSRIESKRNQPIRSVHQRGAVFRIKVFAPTVANRYVKPKDNSPASTTGRPIARIFRQAGRLLAFLAQRGRWASAKISSPRVSRARPANIRP